MVQGQCSCRAAALHVLGITLTHLISNYELLIKPVDELQLLDTELIIIIRCVREERYLKQEQTTALRSHMCSFGKYILFYCLSKSILALESSQLIIDCKYIMV